MYDVNTWNGRQTDAPTLGWIQVKFGWQVTHFGSISGHSFFNFNTLKLAIIKLFWSSWTQIPVKTKMETQQLLVCMYKCFADDFSFKVSRPVTSNNTSSYHLNPADCLSGNCCKEHFRWSWLQLGFNADPFVCHWLHRKPGKARSISLRRIQYADDISWYLINSSTHVLASNFLPFWRGKTPERRLNLKNKYAWKTICSYI